VEDKKEEERWRKSKEVESTEAAIRKQEMEAQEMEARKAKKKTTLLAKKPPVIEQESSIRDKLSDVGQLLKEINVMLKDTINKNDKAALALHIS